jgi:hypothetical protein
MTDITDKNFAKTIDLLNELVIQYYTGKINFKPTPDNFHEEIYKLDKSIDSTKFQLLIHVMEDLGYLKTVNKEDELGRGYVGELHSTTKGWALYLNGGLSKEVNTEDAKYRFYKWGQIAVMIAGVYYLIELFKDLMGFYTLYYCK